MGISDPNIVRAVLQETYAMELGHFNSLIDHAKELVTDLLCGRMFKDKCGDEVKKIAKRLTEGYMYHNRVINFSECKEIGLKTEKLEGEELNITYRIYKIIKDLFNEVDKAISPMMGFSKQVFPILHIKKHVIGHGIIYLPELEFPTFE